MAYTLEELVIEFKADFTKFDAELDRASAKARGKARDIEGLKIKPSVDHRPLVALNEHLSLKERHFKQVQELYKKGITLGVNYQDKAFGKGIPALKHEIRHTVTASLRDSNKDLEKEIKNVASAVKATKPGILGNLIKPIASTGSALVGGLFQGVGINLSKKFSKGLSNEIEVQLSNYIGSFDFVGKSAAKKMVSKFQESSKTFNKAYEAVLEAQATLRELTIPQAQLNSFNKKEYKRSIDVRNRKPHDVFGVSQKEFEGYREEVSRKQTTRKKRRADFVADPYKGIEVAAYNAVSKSEEFELAKTQVAGFKETLAKLDKALVESFRVRQAILNKLLVNRFAETPREARERQERVTARNIERRQKLRDRFAIEKKQLEEELTATKYAQETTADPQVKALATLEIMRLNEASFKNYKRSQKNEQRFTPLMQTQIDISRNKKFSGYEEVMSIEGELEKIARQQAELRKEREALVKIADTKINLASEAKKKYALTQSPEEKKELAAQYDKYFVAAKGAQGLIAETDRNLADNASKSNKLLEKLPEKHKASRLKSLPKLQEDLAIVDKAIRSTQGKRDPLLEQGKNIVSELNKTVAKRKLGNNTPEQNEALGKKALELAQKRDEIKAELQKLDSDLKGQFRIRKDIIERIGYRQVPPQPAAELRGSLTRVSQSISKTQTDQKLTLAQAEQALKRQVDASKGNKVAQEAFNKAADKLKKQINVDKFVEQVLADLGIDVNSIVRPTVRGSKGMGKMRASYNAFANEITLRQDLYDAVGSGKIDDRLYKTAAHELSHAIDYDFGSKKGVEAKLNGRALHPLDITSKEYQETIPGLGLGSIREFVRRYPVSSKPTELNAEARARRALKKRNPGLFNQPEKTSYASVFPDPWGDAPTAPKVSAKQVASAASIAQANAKIVTERIEAIGQAFQGATKKLQLPSKKELKGLSTSQLADLARETQANRQSLINSAVHAIEEINKLMASVPKNQRFGHPLAALKGRLQTTINQNKNKNPLQDLSRSGTPLTGVNIPNIVVPEVYKPQPIEFEKAGANSVKGLVAGMLGELEELKKVSLEMANIPLDTIEKEQDMHSPSEETKKKGRFTIQGYINGIRSLLPEVRKLFTNKSLLGDGFDRVKETIKKDLLPNPVTSIASVDRRISEEKVRLREFLDREVDDSPTMNLGKFHEGGNSDDSPTINLIGSTPKSENLPTTKQALEEEAADRKVWYAKQEALKRELKAIEQKATTQKTATQNLGRHESIQATNYRKEQAAAKASAQAAEKKAANQKAGAQKDDIPTTIPARRVTYDLLNTTSKASPAGTELTPSQRAIINEIAGKPNTANLRQVNAILSNIERHSQQAYKAVQKLYENRGGNHTELREYLKLLQSINDVAENNVSERDINKLESVDYPDRFTEEEIDLKNIKGKRVPDVDKVLQQNATELVHLPDLNSREKASVVGIIDSLEKQSAEIAGINSLLHRTEANAIKADIALEQMANPTPHQKMGSFIRNNLSGLKSLVLGAVSLYGGIQAFHLLGQKMKEGIELAIRYDRTLNVLNALNLVGAENSLARVSDRAKELSIDIMATREAYAKFQGAMKFTNISGQAEQMFGDFALGASAMQLDPQRTQLMFDAISQMSAKSTVSLEELRQQLGEQLPVAMSLAAKSMNMSQAEFIKLVESGQVLADDLLPRLSKEIRNTFIGSTEATQNSFFGQSQRFKNNLQEISLAFGKMGAEIAKNVLPSINALLDGVSKNAGLIPEVLTVIASSLTGVGLSAVLASGIATKALSALALGVTKVSAATLVALKEAIAVTGASLAIGFAVYGAVKAFQYFNDMGSKELKDLAKQSRETVDSIKAELNRLNGTAIEFKVTRPKEWWESGLDGYANFLNWGKKGNDRHGGQYMNTDEMKAMAIAENKYDALNDLMDEIGLKSRNLFNPENTEAYIKQITELTKKQQKLQTTIRIIGQTGDLSDPDTEVSKLKTKYGENVDGALEKAKEELAEITKQIQETEFKFSPGGLKGLEEALEKAKAARDELNKMGDDQGGQEATTFINLLEKAISKTKDVTVKLTEEVTNAVREFRNLSTVVENNAFDKDLATTKRNTGLNQQIATKGIYGYNRESAQLEIERQNLEEEGRLLKERLTQYEGYIASRKEQKRRELEAALETTLESAKPGDISKARAKLEDNYNGQIPKDIESVLSALEQVKVAEKDISSNLESQTGLRVRQLDLVRQHAIALRQLKITETDVNRRITTLQKFPLGGAKSALEDAHSELKKQQSMLAEQYKQLAEVKNDPALKETIAQTKLAIAQAQNSIISQQHGLRKELRGFDRTLRDYFVGLEQVFIDNSRAIEDYNRSLDDFDISVADFGISSFREARGIQEAYDDLMRSLNKQLLQTQNEIKQIARDIEVQQLRKNLLGNLTPGYNSLAKRFGEAIISAKEQLNQVANNRDNLALKPLDIQEQALQLARQIRSLQEQIYDAQRNQLKQLRDFYYQQVNLQRQYVDLQRSQLQKFHQINDQWEDIITTSQEMGINLGKISDKFKGILNRIPDLKNTPGLNSPNQTETIDVKSAVITDSELLPPPPVAYIDGGQVRTPAGDPDLRNPVPPKPYYEPPKEAPWMKPGDVIDWGGGNRLEGTYVQQIALPSVQDVRVVGGTEGLITDFFKDKGINNPYGLAATLGNFRQEGTDNGIPFNPYAYNESSGAYGVAQWLGSRKTNLLNRYPKTGDSGRDLLNQLEFAWSEMSASQKKALQAARSIDEAMRVWNGFERWDGWQKGRNGREAGNRYDFAEGYLNTPSQSQGQGTLTRLPQASIPHTPIPTPDFTEANRIVAQQRQLAEQKVQLETQQQGLVEENTRTKIADELLGIVRQEEDSTRQTLSTLKDQKATISDMVLGAKGFLTYQERWANAGRDTGLGFDRQLETIQQSKRALQEQVNKWNEEREQRKREASSLPGGLEAFERLDKANQQRETALKQTESLEKQLEYYKAIAIESAKIRFAEEERLNALQNRNGIMGDLYEKRAKNADPISAIGLNHKSAQLGIESDYARQMFDLKRGAESGMYTPTQIREMTEALTEMKDLDLKSAFMEANPFAQSFNEGLVAIFTNAQSASDALRNFAISLLNMAAQWAASNITKSLFGGGGFLSGLFGMNPTKSNPLSIISGGGGFGISEPALPIGFASDGMEVPKFQNFNGGGEVLALGLGVMDAMRLEGAKATPIVAHVGEQILTTKNGDAQFWRAMEQSGQWDELKANKVENFASGGAVGCGNSFATGSRRPNSRSNSGMIVNNNFNIVAPEPNRFRHSKSQYLADAEARSRRAFDRNG